MITNTIKYLRHATKVIKFYTHYLIYSSEQPYNELLLISSFFNGKNRGPERLTRPVRRWQSQDANPGSVLYCAASGSRRGDSTTSERYASVCSFSCLLGMKWQLNRVGTGRIRERQQLGTLNTFGIVYKKEPSGSSHLANYVVYFSPLHLANSQGNTFSSCEL